MEVYGLISDILFAVNAIESGITDGAAPQVRKFPRSLTQAECRHSIQLSSAYKVIAKSLSECSPSTVAMASVLPYNELVVAPTAEYCEHSCLSNA